MRQINANLAQFPGIKYLRRLFGLEKRSTTYRNPAPYLIAESTSGVLVSEQATVGITAIWRGLSIIASSIGSMPKHVVEEDDNGNISMRKSHPLYYIINSEPHPYYTSFDFFAALMYQTILRGNGIALINRSARSQRPTSFRLIENKDVISILPGTGDKGDMVFYKIKGFDAPIPHTEIIHIKNTTANGVEGLDVLKIHFDNFGLDLASRNTASTFYKNGAQLSGILTTDQVIAPEQRESMEKSWNAKYSGAGASGKTPVLTGGLKYQSIAASPADAQLLDSRQFNVYEAARIIGISPHLLFALDRANFSNIETLSLEFAKYTLSHWVNRLEEEFNRKIFRQSERGRVKVNLNMDAFMRGDAKARGEYIQNLILSGVITVNEARRMEGINSVEGGNVRMVPLNMVLVDEEGNIIPTGQGALQTEQMAPAEAATDTNTQTNGNEGASAA